MVGTRKGSKSKSKGLTLVPAEPEPLDISNDESADGPSYGEKEENETSDQEFTALEEEAKAEIIAGPVFGGGLEEEQISDEVNAEDKDVQIEMNDILIVDRAEDVCTTGDKEENAEEGSDGGDAATNVDVKNNEEEPAEDKEEPEEDEEPMNCGVDNEDVNPGKVEKSLEVMTEGVTNDHEALAASEHGLVESMTEDLENDQANELNAKEPMNTPADDGKEDSIKENASTSNEVKAVTQKVTGPKKKIIKKKLVKKKIALGKVVTAVDEAKLHPSDGKDGSAESSKADTSNVVKPQLSVINKASDEACKVDTNEHLKDEKKVEVKPTAKVNKKLNRLRKRRVPGGHSGVAAESNEQKLKPTNAEPESKENNKTEQGIKNEEAENPEDKASRLRRKKNNKVVKKDTLKANDNDIDKPGSSKKGKSPKKMESMGMIFMCSSETKKDCYQYKVLGLPAAKKDIVSKIYKGMRLFLFDFKLRMLYGIYKAAGPGGYNIQPKAFKSQFPSQVRFTVLEDCLPLAEEKFKKVIKDNYYTKNKFDCQLTNEQVKNLCKLFHETTKKAESRRENGNRRDVTSSSIRRERKRKRIEDSRRAGPVSVSSLERGRRRRRSHEEVRRVPVVIDERYHQPPAVYNRETYLPPVASATLYQPSRVEDPPRTRSYYERAPGVDTYERAPGVDAYERALAVDTYRRDSTLVYPDRGLSGSRELGLSVERSYHDPYVLYREPPVYREPAYDPDARREHYNYSSDGRYTEYYRSADYRPPPPLYRRY